MANKIKLLCLSSFLFLGACSDSGVTEIQTWMDQVKKETPVRVNKVPEPKVFVPVPYNGDSLIDPFDPKKLLVIFARMREASDKVMQPDFDRAKEALEGYALETMRMVGTIEKGKERKALIQVGKPVFPVSVGSYIGQNYGKVIAISESRVDLVEKVQDATGDWIERKASLELQEAKK